MNCPVDNTELRMSDRGGVEIDYCPQCRGVWLDRGELDKIIDRSAAEWDRVGERVDDRDYDRDYDRDHDRGRRRKRGWLGDMFEFGD